MLGITQNLITSSTVEIHKIIPTLSDESLKEDNFEEGQSNDEYLKNVKEYLLGKYKTPQIVICKKNDESNSFLNKNNRNISSKSIVKDYNENDALENSISSKKRIDNNDEKINLTIIDLTLNGKSEGYIFKLETLNLDLNSSKIIVSSDKEETREKLDMNFIPNVKVLFDLDPKKGAFRKNTNIAKIKKFIENEANNKMQSLVFII